MNKKKLVYKKNIPLYSNKFYQSNIMKGKKSSSSKSFETAQENAGTGQRKTRISQEEMARSNFFMDDVLKNLLSIPNLDRMKKMWNASQRERIPQITMNPKV